MRPVCAVALICTACNCGEDSPLPPVLTDLATSVATSHYATFAERALTMSEATDALCADPTATTLEAARQAWWSTREPWKRAELVKFGPTEEFPERLGPKLDFWPVSEEAVEELVASTDPVAAADFGRQGASRRGLPVVEYLLWSGGEDTLAGLTATPRRCDAAAGAATDVASSASTLLTTWQTPWTGRLTAPADDPSDTYDTEQDVLDEWVNRMAFTVENIRLTKLGKPLGDGTGPQLDALESRFSGRSLQDARDALDGVAHAWRGGVDEAGNGVEDLVTDPALTEEVSSLIEIASTRLGEVPEPLSTTLTVEPEVVQRAQDALRILQVAIQVDLAQELSVTVTFNDNDGDG
ncbi:MAG: imelysin family protein [Myxococcales bacterium]|nr:imelysin family protein [Myxococcales bacterium]